MKLFVALSVILLLVVSANFSKGQNSDIELAGRLVYIRDTGEIVSLFNQTRQIFNVRQVFDAPADFCWTLSQQGTYIAYSTMSAESLIIRSIESEEIILQQAWSSDWKPCAFWWKSDDILAIEDQNSQAVPRVTFDFDISDGTLLPYVAPSSNVLTFPELPNGSAELFYLPSPDRNIYLYESCTGEIILDGDSNHSCSVVSSLVIYDVVQGEDIHTITDTDSAGITCCAVASINASWSPDGRYLAYDRTIAPQGVEPEDYVGFFLRVYDTRTRQYLDTAFGSQAKDPFHGYDWSHDGSKLTLWILADFSNEAEHVSTPLIFDTGNSDYIIVDSAFQQAEQVFWSPDDAALVFIEVANQSLIYVDANIGTASILDDAVTRIVAWGTG